MASSPPANLPLFYKNLQPLSSALHGKLKAKSNDKAPYLATVHAVPLTIDEFTIAQRFYPIVFSAGENSVPLALMGLNEGVNVFIDEEGKPHNPVYIPAYVRRYPYILARTDPSKEELTLCFDPDSDLVGESGDGQPLFDGDKASETLNGILKFCEEFETSAQRTNAFMKELETLDLLIDGEVSVQPEGAPQPFIYRGFKMVDEQKLRDMNGDQLRKVNQNGILPLVMAHLFSLTLIREIFGRQLQQGKLPEQPAPATIEGQPAPQGNGQTAPQDDGEAAAPSANGDAADQADAIAGASASETIEVDRDAHRRRAERLARTNDEKDS